MLNAKNIPGGGNTGTYDPLDEGSYPARLVMIVDMGVQAQRPYKGEAKKPAPEISLTYELVDEFAVDDAGEEIPDKPRWVWETMPLYNLMADRATSTKRYLGIDPTQEFEGDWSKLLGAPCMVTLTVWESKDGSKKGNNVSHVSSMRDKDKKKCAELVNDPVVFDMDNPDIEVFNGLSDYMKNKIKGGLEYAGSPLQVALDGGETSDDESNEEGKGW